MKFSSNDLKYVIRNFIAAHFTVARRKLISDVGSKAGLGLLLGIVFKRMAGVEIYLTILAFILIFISVLIVKDEENK